MKLVITGATGNVGTSLLAALRKDTTIDEIVGIARRPAEIEEPRTRFVQADIDFRLFHESLLHLVSYLNGIHECYVAQAMGLQAYEAFVQELPQHLQGSFVTARLQDRIKPLLGASDYRLGAAA